MAIEEYYNREGKKIVIKEMGDNHLLNSYYFFLNARQRIIDKDTDTYTDTEFIQMDLLGKKIRKINSEKPKAIVLLKISYLIASLSDEINRRGLNDLN
jgi:hypothetical protein